MDGRPLASSISRRSTTGSSPSAGSRPRRARSPRSTIVDRVPAARRVAADRAVPGRGALPGRDARDLPGAARPAPGRRGLERARDPRGRRLDGLRRARRPGRRAASCCTRCAPTASSRSARTSSSSAGRRTRGAGLGGTVDVRPVGVEQSNSSIVFGDELIMKAFRRIEPGVNPELELLRFLVRPRLPAHRLAGRLVRGRRAPDRRHARDPAGVPGSASATAGSWRWTSSPATPRACWTGCEALGAVIGELHTALGSDNSDPAFAPDEPSMEALSILTADVDEQIERVFLDLPETEATAPIRGPRPGRAREARGALARQRRRHA